MAFTYSSLAWGAADEAGPVNTSLISQQVQELLKGERGLMRAAQALDYAVDEDSVELVVGLLPGFRGSVIPSGEEPEGLRELRRVTARTGTIAVTYDVPLSKLAGTVDALCANRYVKFIETNQIYRVALNFNDPGLPQQWAIPNIRADKAWEIQRGSRSILVAVIDTGIDYNHPDLAGNYVPLGYDWVNDDADPMDDQGHGTHCAGVIAATMNNTIGITGLANVTIMAEKGLSKYGSGNIDDLASCIVHAVDQGADILSNSWGGYGDSYLLRDAVAYAQEHGVLVIAAAGNDAKSDPFYPAFYSEVIAVTATDSNNASASFTNYGYWVEVAAPGVSIYSTIPDNAYASWSGTSMAAPQVAGVAALAWSQYSTHSAEQIRNILNFFATDLGALGFDEFYGSGKIDAYAIFQTLPSHDIEIQARIVDTLFTGQNLTIPIKVRNVGTSNETGIIIQLLINETVHDSISIPLVKSMSTVDTTFSWTAPSPALYNLTIATQSIPEDANPSNNVVMALVKVDDFNILLVNDDDARNYIKGTSVNVFQTILDELDLSYYTWSESILGHPALGVLKNFEQVIWTCGDYWNKVVDPIDTELLYQYVQSGNSLLIEGEDIGYDHGNDMFMLTVLNALYFIDDDPSGSLNIYDPTHPLVTGLSQNIPLIIHPPYADGVEPINYGSKILEYNETGYAALVASEPYIAGYTIYIPFPLYCLNDFDALILVNNSLNWMKPENDLAVELDAPLFLKPGQTGYLNFSITNRGSLIQTNIQLRLIINGTVMQTETIPALESKQSASFNYGWTPNKGKYIVSVQVDELPSEIHINNNIDTREIKVGTVFHNYGDIILCGSETLVIQDVELHQHGNIIIQDSASFIVINSTVYFYYDNYYKQIVISGNGQLIVNNSTFYSNTDIPIYLYDNSKANITFTEFLYSWNPLEPSGSIVLYDNSAINAYEITIAYCELYGWSWANISNTLVNYIYSSDASFITLDQTQVDGYLYLSQWSNQTIYASSSSIGEIYLSFSNPTSTSNKKLVIEEIPNHNDPFIHETRAWSYAGGVQLKYSTSTTYYIAGLHSGFHDIWESSVEIPGTSWALNLYNITVDEGWSFRFFDNVQASVVDCNITSLACYDYSNVDVDHTSIKSSISVSWYGTPILTIRNSNINYVPFNFMDKHVTVLNLYPGYCYHWSAFENINGIVNWSLTIDDSWIQGWGIYASTSSEVNIINSELLYIFCYSDSAVYIENSTIGEIYCMDFSYLLLGFTDVKNLYCWGFQGTIDCNDVYLEDWLSVSDSNLVLRGEITFNINFQSRTYVQYSNITRDYFLWSKPGVEYQVYFESGPKVIEGTTDAYGRGWFTVLYNDQNFTSACKLVLPLYHIDTPVNLWSNTPIYFIILDHDIALNLEAPLFLRPGDSTLLNVTIINRGANPETNVELNLTAATDVGSPLTIIEVFPSIDIGEVLTYSYSWAPNEGLWVVEATVAMDQPDDYPDDNRYSTLVDVSHSPSHYGNIVINGDEKLVIRNITLTQYGDITVNGQGQLIIENSTLILYSDDDDSIITSNHQGVITVFNSKISSNNWILVYLYDESQCNILNTNICYSQDESWINGLFYSNDYSEFRAIKSRFQYLNSYEYSDAYIVECEADWLYFDTYNEAPIIIENSVIYGLYIGPWSASHVELEGLNVRYMEIGFTGLLGSTQDARYEVVKEADPERHDGLNQGLHILKDDAPVYTPLDDAISAVIYVKDLRPGFISSWDSVDEVGATSWSLTLENSTISSGWYLSFFNQVNVVVTNSTLYYLQAYDYSKITIYDSSLDYVFLSDWYGSPEVTIYNSSINTPKLHFTQPTVDINGLRPGYFGDWSPSDYITGPHNWDLRLHECEIEGGWGLDVTYVCELSVTNSTLLSVYAYDKPSLTINDCDVYYLYVWDNPSVTVDDTDIQYLYVGDYSQFYVVDSCIDRLGFYNLMKEIGFINTKVSSEWNCYSSDTIVLGTMSFGDAVSTYLYSSKLKREYLVLGFPDTEVTVSSGGVPVWSGTIPGSGQLSYYAVFTDANYTSALTLETSTMRTESLTLTTDTPIMLPYSLEIDLYAGWNLIGFPFTEQQISDVFAGHLSKVECIYGYRSGGWVYWIPGVPSTLNAFQGGYGYWVKAVEPFQVALVGDNFVGPEAQIGWNLLSIPTFEDIPLTEEEYTGIEYIYGYDNQLKTYSVWVSGLPSQFQQLKKIEPGKGYWFKLTP